MVIKVLRPLLSTAERLPAIFLQPAKLISLLPALAAGKATLGGACGAGTGSSIWGRMSRQSLAISTPESGGASAQRRRNP
jgi:hypothetical protein